MSLQSWVCSEVCGPSSVRQSARAPCPYINRRTPAYLHPSCHGVVPSHTQRGLHFAPSAPSQAHRLIAKASDASVSGTEHKVEWWKRDPAPNMKDIEGIQQLVDELADARDRLVIVEFFAPWCNACKALYPKICKIMNEHVDDVLFLKVSFEDNKDVCKTLGVKVLPYFHFYRGCEGRVDAFSCTVSKVQKLRDAIENYASPFCSLSDITGLEEFPDIKPHGGYSSADESALHPDANKPTDLRKVAWS